MRAGDLDRRISFQRATSTQDESGEPTRTWQTFYTCWAAKKRLSASEQFSSDQLVAKAQDKYVIRWNSEQADSIKPNETIRIVDGSSYYDITAVDDTRRRDGELTIYAFARAEAA